MKKIISFFILLLLIGFSFSCKRENEDKKDEEKNPISCEILGPSEIVLGEVSRFRLSESYDQVKWDISNDNISITVEGEFCLVTGIKLGEAELKATIEDTTITKKINVIEGPHNVTILGFDTITVGEAKSFSYTYDGDNPTSITWSSSNDEIAIVSDGVVKGIKVGKVTINLTIDGNEGSFEVEVVNEKANFDVRYPEVLNINQSARISVFRNGELVDEEAISLTLDTETAEKEYVKINGLTIKGFKAGDATISVNYGGEVVAIFRIVVMNAIQTLQIYGRTEMEMGEYQNLLASIDEPLEYSTSDDKVLLVNNGTVLAVNIGEATITAINPATYEEAEIIITVTRSTEHSFDPSIVSQAYIMLQDMTVEEKIGQMFIMGIDKSGVTDSFISAVQNQHIGNIIYMGANVTDPSKIYGVSTDVQNLMMEYNKIPAFISTDQEGGRVARLQKEATHFVSQMCVGATNDPTYAYKEGLAIGSELQYYGINCDLAPVMDVNNNPDNSVIGTRSYGDNPVVVALYGTNSVNGFKETNTLSCLKHFPGHGNTNVDSHYGLPVITTAKENLFSIELAPFISGIHYGVDAIMTAHIIFSAIDADLPATLSSKVLTDLLRDQLGYNGLIITDGMEMGALDIFGDAGELATKAVLAGAEILTYTTISGAVKGYKGVLASYKSGRISIDIIDKAVLRILETKLKYNLFETKERSTNYSEELSKHKELNLQIAKAAVTRVVGDFNGLESKNEKVLIISPTSGYSFGDYLINSLAYVCQDYLTKEGYKHIDYYTPSNTISNSDKTKLLERLTNYDTVIIAFQNVQKNNITETIEFINEACKKASDSLKIVIVGLDSPYDYIKYRNVTNYFNLYSYLEVNAIAFAKFLNNEYELTGVSPVKLK